jgi:hypothetical protein
MNFMLDVEVESWIKECVVERREKEETKRVCTWKWCLFVNESEAAIVWLSLAPSEDGICKFTRC